MNEAGQRKLDKVLRRRLLSVLHAAREHAPLGGINARTTMDTVDDAQPEGRRHRDSEHCVGLLRDLQAGGYIEMRDTRKRRTQIFGIDHLFAAITAKGTALLNESIPADPEIDDERNLE